MIVCSTLLIYCEKLVVFYCCLWRLYCNACVCVSKWVCLSVMESVCVCAYISVVLSVWYRSSFLFQNDLANALCSTMQYSKYKWNRKGMKLKLTHKFIRASDGSVVVCWSECVCMFVQVCLCLWLTMCFTCRFVWVYVCTYACLSLFECLFKCLF